MPLITVSEMEDFDAAILGAGFEVDDFNIVDLKDKPTAKERHPITGTACVIHRPGYVARYKGQYKKKLWHMCKTTYSILIERAAKFADEHGCKLEIYYEGSGRKEDRDIIRYARALKTEGCPFNDDTSGRYFPLLPEHYRRIVLGEPHQKTKKCR